MAHVSHCTMCGTATGHVELPEETAERLALALGVQCRREAGTRYVAYVCLTCQYPYLVVWPELASVEEAQSLAGFLPKGGRG